MDLDQLKTFVKVAELASFTRAAEQLGMPKAKASALVQRLEADLGTRLLQRTTRSVRLTPDGEQLFERGQLLVADADELRALFQRSPGALRGKLRVDLPNSIARTLVIPRLPEFLSAHPLLEVELSTTDRRVDPVHDGFDCVLRIGALHDSGLVALRVGVLTLANYASPAYLRAHGTPQTLADLDRHLLVHYAPTLGAPSPGWEYHDGERWRFHPMRGVISVNGTDAYQAACLAGLGIIQAPVIGSRAQVAQGLLVEVLPQFVGEPMPVSIVYANRRHQPKRVAAFIEWLKALVAPHLA